MSPLWPLEKRRAETSCRSQSIQLLPLCCVSAQNCLLIHDDNPHPDCQIIFLLQNLRDIILELFRVFFSDFGAYYYFYFFHVCASLPHNNFLVEDPIVPWPSPALHIPSQDLWPLTMDHQIGAEQPSKEPA